VRQVTETTVKELRRTLQEGWDAGEGIEKLARRVREVFDRADRYRSFTIARTETTNVANMAQLAVMREAGVGYKTWWAALDERMCPLCGALHGKTVRIDEEFEPGVFAPSRHPNCRCTLVSGTGEQSAYYTEVPGLQRSAEEGLARAFDEAINFGKATGNECLISVDVNTGLRLHSRIEGEKDRVVFPEDLIKLYTEAKENSIVMVHNHPKSSSFSTDDLMSLARFRSIKYLAVIGHDGTRYIMDSGGGQMPSREDLVRQYQEGNRRYYQRFYGLVVNGKMTIDDAWKEHSHLINVDVAKAFGWKYRRVMPGER